MLLDGRHDPELAEAQMAGLGPTPGRPVGAEDIRDLQRRTRHGRRGLRLALLLPGQVLQRALDRA